MKRVARTSRAEQFLIAAFLGLAAFATSTLTSIGQPETQLTERSRAQQPAGARAENAVDAARLRTAGRG